MAVVGENSYGKRNVRFLRVVKETPKHEVFEMTGYSQLEGNFDKAYTHSDNSAILPTETQKNTFYALSKKYPIDPIERWAWYYARDVLARHAHIDAVNVSLDRNPFERVVVNGVEHNHVFKKGSNGIRFVQVRVPRNGNVNLIGGFKDFSIMKTTQSGFEGYIQDEYTTLPSTGDRILATKIHCEWKFVTGIDVENVKFNQIADSILETTLRIFSGPADKGVYSASVQHTAFEIGEEVLRNVPEIESLRFVLPNIHYYPVNFSDFKTTMQNKGEVFLTFDGAAGDIRVTVERKRSARL